MAFCLESSRVPQAGPFSDIHSALQKANSPEQATSISDTGTITALQKEWDEEGY